MKKVKSHIFKTLLISAFLLYFSNSYSAQISDLIRTWKQKGYITLTIPVKFDALEPTSSLNAHTKFSLSLIYEPLLSIAANQELQPFLAESWLISHDKKSVTINIKKNHYFSDNTEVTSKDVLYSIQRACRPGSKVFEELKGLVGCNDYANGKRIKPEVFALGKYVVKFNIESSPTNFLNQLSSPSFAITKQTNSGLIGSGAYVVTDKNSDYLVLNKNLYSSIDHSAKNNGIVIFYANQHDLPTILKNDKPDGSIMYRMQDIWNIRNDHYKRVKVNPNITETLVLNNQRFPFNHAIVRKAVLSQIYNHYNVGCIHGAHKAYGIIPHGTGGSIDNAAPDLLTEISAQEVFKEVPALKSKKTKMTIHQLLDLKNECESNQIINAAKHYNIDIKFQYHKNYSTLVPLYINHKLDGFIELYVFRNREAYSTLQFFTKNGENNANIDNSSIDNMLKNAINEPSSHGRFQAYRKISEYMHNEGIVIPLFYTDHANLLSKCIAGTSDNFLFNPFIYIPQLYKIKGCHI